MITGLFALLVMWVCLLGMYFVAFVVLTRESGSERYVMGRDYPYDQDAENK